MVQKEFGPFMKLAVEKELTKRRMFPSETTLTMHTPNADITVIRGARSLKGQPAGSRGEMYIGAANLFFFRSDRGDEFSRTLGGPSRVTNR